MSPILLQPGDKLVSYNNESYTIKKILREGGFAIVYLAMDNHQKKIVAIKTLNFRSQNKERREVKKICQAFEQEAEMLKFCSNPNIVTIEKIIYSPDIPNLPFIVMEYIKGETLKQYVKKQKTKKLSIPESLIYTQQICDALALVHERGILHRDINPSNIIIRSGKLQAVLIDFGISKYDVPEEEQNFTKELGESRYAPSERSFDERYDKRDDKNKKEGKYTDVYSVTGVLKFMLTGNDPPYYSQLSQRECISDMSSELKKNKIDANIIYAIHKGMSREIDKRYQSVEELWTDLNEHDNHDFLDEFKLLTINIEKEIDYVFDETMYFAKHIIKGSFFLLSLTAENTYFLLKNTSKIVLYLSIFVGLPVLVLTVGGSILLQVPSVLDKSREDSDPNTGELQQIETQGTKENQVPQLQELTEETEDPELPETIQEPILNPNLGTKIDPNIDNNLGKYLDILGREKTVVEIYEKYKQETTKASGAIISKTKNRYIILTTAYSILGGNADNLRIKTFDGQIHEVEKIENPSENIDIALIYFKSPFIAYPSAPVDDSLKSLESNKNYQEEFFMNNFNLRKNHTIKLVNSQEMPDLDRKMCKGYQHIFEGDIPPGMNGSPIFNNRKEIVGIYCGEDNNSLKDKKIHGNHLRKIRVIPIKLIRNRIFGANRNNNESINY
ncbi:MAG: protein kinase [Crocosphaera sp.]